MRYPYGTAWLISLNPVGTFITSLFSPNLLLRSILKISRSDKGSADSDFYVLKHKWAPIASPIEIDVFRGIQSKGGFWKNSIS